MTSQNKYRTAGEIDALCTKCGMDLTHTVMAMVGPKVVKVKCKTCGAEHVYRGDPPSPKAAPRAAKASVRFEDRVKGRNLAAAKKYSPREVFQVDDVIDHPTFGLGVVTANRGDKMDVAFRAFEKTLVNGKAPARS